MIAFYQNGQVQPNILPWDFKFSATKGSFSGTVYNAPAEPGSYLIFVSYKKTIGLSIVTVQGSEAVKQIEIIPGKVTLSPGEECTFQSKVIGASGNVIQFKPAWGARGGKIDQDGNFKAGSQPGSFTVIAQGPGGIKASCNIVIQEQAAPQLTRLEIQPTQIKLRSGESVVFSVKGFDQFGKEIGANVQWSSSSGKVDQSGKFTADENPGSVTIIAVQNNIRAQASVEVEVVPAQLTRIEIQPAQIKIKTGESATFSVKGFDQFGKETGVNVQWSSSAGKIDQSGKFTADENPGSVTIIAVQNNIRAQASVEVEAIPAQLVRLEIQPAQIKIKTGESAAFSVKGSDQFGKEMGVNVQWSSSAGKIDQNGKFTADENPGNVTIIAVQNNVKAQASVEVEVVPAQLVRLEIQPRQAKIKTGESVAFFVKGFDQFGKEMGVNVQWSSSAGKIDQNGKFTADENPDNVTIIAVQNNVKAQASVEVEAIPVRLMRIEIHPRQAKIKTGESVIFSVKGFDQFGKEMDVPVQWSSSTGKIEQDGKFTADENPGNVTISAIHKESGISAKIEMEILVPEGKYELIVSPQKSTVSPGEKLRYSASLYRDGKEQWTWPWEFNCQASEGSFEDMVYTAPTKPGIYEIKIRHYKAIAVAVVIVKNPQSPEKIPDPPRPVVVKIQVDPKNVELTCGQTYSFKAAPVDKDGNILKHELFWIVQGGTISLDGKFTAGSEVGTYKIRVTEPMSGISEEIVVTIKKPVIQHYIKVNPTSAVLAPGGKVKFQIKLFRGIYEVWTWPWEFKAVTSGGDFQDDVYTAPQKPGKYQISIRHANASLDVTVEVIDVKLEPAQSEIKPEEKVQFTLVGAEEKMAGNVQWSCTGGTIDPQGSFTAGTAPGNYTVTAKIKDSEIVLQSSVTIKPADVLRLVIDPESANLEPGNEVSFSVSVFRNENKIDISPSEIQWNSTGGALDKNTYKAPMEEGKYTVTVSLRGITASAVVIVKAAPKKISRISVSPAKAVLKSGQKQMFKAQCFDQGDNPMFANITWKATGGEITQEGIFTAGKEFGEYQIQAVVEEGLTAEAIVTVQPSLSGIVIVPSQMSLRPGQKYSFKAKGILQNQEETEVKVSWSATGGQIDQDGTFIAGDEEGTGFFAKAFDSTSGLEGLCSIQIKSAVAVRLEIVPGEVTVACGKQQQFILKGYDGDNNASVISPRWFATGGTITQSGAYTAGYYPGYFEVTAIDNKSNLFTRALIRVSLSTEDSTAEKEVYKLKVEPGDRIVSPGENVWLKPTLYSHGQAVWCAPWEFKYKATGGIFIGDYGNIWIAPTTPGKYTLTVSHRDASAVLSMTIEGKLAEPKISRLVITPSKIMIYSGEKCAFSAKAYNESGDVVECPVIWNATGGIIDAGGNYLAGNISGTYQVWAQTKGNPAIKSSVEVVITFKQSFYGQGFKWGYSMAQGTSTRNHLIQFIIKDLFFRQLSAIHQFKQGFGLGYGVNGATVINEIWQQVVSWIGESYGSRLRTGSVSEYEVINFIHSYIGRLPVSDRQTFKAGFLRGYPNGGNIYKNLQKKAMIKE